MIIKQLGIIGASLCIFRSRNQGILDSCDIVVDVGGVYNPSKHRYDHHMR